MLANLQLNQLTRQIPVEVIYDLMLAFQNSQDSDEKTRLLESMYTWTARRDSDGELVYVGSFGAGGARVSARRPDGPPPDFGVVFSHSQ